MPYSHKTYENWLEIAKREENNSIMSAYFWKKERLIKKCGIDLGSFVKSLAGRDKGQIFIVVGVEDNYVYIVDGDIRKVENPKRKKIKHVELTRYFDENIAERISKKNKITNQDIKRVIKEIQEM